MLYGFLVTLYTISSLFLMLIVMVQKGKGSMGLGGLGGGTQLLFGGSGGQDIFQKITWILGTIFISGSLILSLMKSRESRTLKYIKKDIAVQQPVQQLPEPSAKTEK